MPKNFSRNSGFTLVELIIVVAILAVMAVILVPRYIMYVDKSRTALCRSNRGEILRDYESRVATGQDVTLSAVLAEYEAAGEKICPSGNDNVTADDTAGTLKCSVHGDEDAEAGANTSPSPSASPTSSGTNGLESLLDFITSKKDSTESQSQLAKDFAAYNKNNGLSDKVSSETIAAVKAASGVSNTTSIDDKQLYWRPRLVKDSNNNNIVVMIASQYTSGNKTNLLYYNGKLYYYDDGKGNLAEGSIGSNIKNMFATNGNGSGWKAVS